MNIPEQVLGAVRSLNGVPYNDDSQDAVLLKGKTAVDLLCDYCEYEFEFRDMPYWIGPLIFEMGVSKADFKA